MEELRKERKTFVGHRCYVTMDGVERDDDAVQQSLADIDAKVTVLYARAKEQLVTFTAKDLTIGASTLRFATNESKAVRDFIAQEKSVTVILVQERQGLCGKVQAIWHQLHIQFSGFQPMSTQLRATIVEFLGPSPASPPTLKTSPPPFCRWNAYYLSLV